MKRSSHLDRSEVWDIFKWFHIVESCFFQGKYKLYRPAVHHFGKCPFLPSCKYLSHAFAWGYITEAISLACCKDLKHRHKTESLKVFKSAKHTKSFSQTKIKEWEDNYVDYVAIYFAKQQAGTMYAVRLEVVAPQCQIVRRLISKSNNLFYHSPQSLLHFFCAQNAVFFLSDITNNSNLGESLASCFFQLSVFRLS